MFLTLLSQIWFSKTPHISIKYSLFFSPFVLVFIRNFIFQFKMFYLNRLLLESVVILKVKDIVHVGLFCVYVCVLSTIVPGSASGPVWPPGRPSRAGRGTGSAGSAGWAPGAAGWSKWSEASWSSSPSRSASPPHSLSPPWASRVLEKGREESKININMGKSVGTEVWP